MTHIIFAVTLTLISWPEVFDDQTGEQQSTQGGDEESNSNQPTVNSGRKGPAGRPREHSSLLAVQSQCPWSLVPWDLLAVRIWSPCLSIIQSMGFSEVSRRRRAL